MKCSIKMPLVSVLPIVAFLAMGTSHVGANIDAAEELGTPTFTLDSRSAAEIWKEECASCHGLDGKGQTKAGKRAGVKDFTDPEYQKSWTDEEALKVVSTATKDGKQLKNKKPWGEKLTQPELKQMVLYVRQFGKKG